MGKQVSKVHPLKARNGLAGFCEEIDLGNGLHIGRMVDEARKNFSG